MAYRGNEHWGVDFSIIPEDQLGKLNLSILDWETRGKVIGEALINLSSKDTKPSSHDSLVETD